MPNVRLVVTRYSSGLRPEESLEVRTDEEGEFELVDLKPGIYGARVVGKGFRGRTYERQHSWTKLHYGVSKVRLDGKGCAEFDLVRERVGSVTVSLLDADGNPLEDRPEGGLRLAASDYLRWSPRRGKPVSPGVYRFEEVPVGPYYLMVVDRSLPNPRFPYGVVMEDGSLSQTATVVQVTADRPDPHLKLRFKPLETVTISGGVMWPNGIRPKHMRVYYERPGGGFFEGVTGRAEFRFEWFRGLKVYLHAESREAHRYARAKPVPITPDGDAEMNFVLDVPAEPTDSPPTHPH